MTQASQQTVMHQFLRLNSAERHVGWLFPLESSSQCLAFSDINDEVLCPPNGWLSHGRLNKSPSNGAIAADRR